MVNQRLVLERNRPSALSIYAHRKHGGKMAGRKRVGNPKPKSATRTITGRKKLGPERRSLFTRIERRLRDKITPQARETNRAVSSIRYMRRKNDKPLLPNTLTVKSQLTKGFRL